MVDVAQPAERQAVALVVVGSNPIVHPLQGSGGIGRRARLKPGCCETYGFKSRGPYLTLVAQLVDAAVSDAAPSGIWRFESSRGYRALGAGRQGTTLIPWD